ncbi:MAG: metal-dependent transcriptional regulator [Candidatus Krumholzibacteriia bacterium]
MIRSAVEDYVKTIYKLSLKNQKVTPSQVAEQLGVSTAAVTKMVRRLQELKLARYVRSQGLSLSPSGRKIALEVVRHHRLLELYLTEALGYSWDQVHDEAEKLEHVISEQFEERIEKLLGYPTHDPHGAPIPTRDGLVERADDRTLANLEPGDHALIQRVSDRNASMLSYLGKLGMYPGTAVEMLEKEPYGGSFRVRISGEDRSIGVELAESVFVTSPGESK